MGSIYYGWQDVRPKSLQWLNHPRWFLVIAALAVFVQSMSVNGLISVNITTLEQRFGLTSTQAGLLPSFYDIFGLPAVIVISSIGNKANKPRWIASGMFLVGIGSIIFAMPHFFTGNYVHSGTGAENQICNSEHAINNGTCGSSNSVDSNSDWYFIYMFLAGIFFLGIGSVPLYVLALTYFDDCLPRDRAALYVGIFYACGTLGPAVAFLLGGEMLNFHTDMDQGITDSILSTSDPRWVGAWWVLFLVTGLMALMVVVPLYGFPRQMSTCEDVKKGRINEAHAKSLFKNPTYAAMILAGVGDVAMISGFVAFGPKYIQNQFSMSAASTGKAFGLIAIPGAAGGSFVGSYLIKRFNMTCKQCLEWQFWISVVTLFFLGLFFIQCNQPPFLGVNIDQYGKDLNKVNVDIKTNCSIECGCNQNSFNPICGHNKITYFSPCHAGCLDQNSDLINYANCSCLNNYNFHSIPGKIFDTSLYNDTAVSGMCTEESCSLFWLFCFVFFGAMFLIYITGMFHLSILVRIVPNSQRDLALGLDMIASRVIGSIPSPIIFGAIIDYSCLLWEKDECSASKGNCIYYANSSMSWYMLMLCLCCQMLVIITCYVAMKTYRQTMSKSANSDVIVDNQIVTFDNSALDVTETDEDRKKVIIDKKTPSSTDTGSSVIRNNTNSITMDNFNARKPSIS